MKCQTKAHEMQCVFILNWKVSYQLQLVLYMQCIVASWPNYFLDTFTMSQESYDLLDSQHLFMFYLRWLKTCPAERSERGFLRCESIKRISLSLRFEFQKTSNLSSNLNPRWLQKLSQFLFKSNQIPCIMICYITYKKYGGLNKN